MLIDLGCCILLVRRMILCLALWRMSRLCCSVLGSRRMSLRGRVIGCLLWESLLRLSRLGSRLRCVVMLKVMGRLSCLGLRAGGLTRLGWSEMERERDRLGKGQTAVGGKRTDGRRGLTNWLPYRNEAMEFVISSRYAARVFGIQRT